MPENIIIQPNKPLYVRLSDPMNTENFNFETREGKFATTSGQVLTLPRPAVLRLYVLEPAPGEEIEILKKWSGKRGEPATWSIRRAQEPASTPAEAAAPDETAPAVETPQGAPTPIRRPSKKEKCPCGCDYPDHWQQKGLFDAGPQKGTGTYGPMPAGVAYAAPRPRLVPASRPPAEVIPWNVAFREVSQWVADELHANGLQWRDEAQQAMVCTVLIAEARKGRIGLWER